MKHSTRRSNPPYIFLRKGVLKICSKFTGEHLCRSVISIKLPSNFIKIALRHGCSPVNLLHISRTPSPENTSGGLILYWWYIGMPNFHICQYILGLQIYTWAISVILLLTTAPPNLGLQCFCKNSESSFINIGPKWEHRSLKRKNSAKLVECNIN